DVRKGIVGVHALPLRGEFHRSAPPSPNNVGDNGVAAKDRERRSQLRPQLPFITWFVGLRLPPA
ncbi:hypothetical protein, partial [Roseiconus lacunae]